MRKFFEIVLMFIVIGALYWVARELEMTALLLGATIGFVSMEFFRWLASDD